MQRKVDQGSVSGYEVRVNYSQVKQSRVGEGWELEQDARYSACDWEEVDERSALNSVELSVTGINMGGSR